MMANLRIYQALWWLVGGLAILDTPLYPGRLIGSFMHRSLNFAFVPVFLTIFSFATVWADQVTTFVPEPYLVSQPMLVLGLTFNPTQDEVFHIPQAQAYCAGRYDVWDPKLTTPPGL
jgi:alpha-1,2-glucosyltransferase